MRHIRIPLLAFLAVLSFTVVAHSQASRYSNLSIGAVLGDPLGLTFKEQFGANHALAVSFGPDYFGTPSLRSDYLWQFNSFHSARVNTYLGPGLVVAFAKGTTPFYSKEPKTEPFASAEDRGFGVGVRSVFGLDYRPTHSPLEFFFEAGPLVAISHIFDLDLDGAIGARYAL